MQDGGGALAKDEPNNRDEALATGVADKIGRGLCTSQWKSERKDG